MLFLSCLLCFHARLFVDDLCSSAGKGLSSCLSFVLSNCNIVTSNWYPGSGVVLDCIDSWSLSSFLLLLAPETDGDSLMTYSAPALVCLDSLVNT